MIESRRTAQQFQDEPIGFELIKEAIELMAYAPNHKHTFPWGAYRLNTSEKKVLIDLLVQKKLSKTTNPSEVQKKAIRSNFESIPEIVVLLQKKQQDSFTQKEDYASVACGVQNLSLFLWQHHIACKWSTTGVMKNQSFQESTQIDWTHWDIEGLLFIGKAKKIPPRPDRPKVLLND